MRGSFGGPFPPFGGGRGINGGGMLRAATRVVARTGVTGSGGGFPESLSASANSTPTSPRRASGGHGQKLNSKNQLSLSSSSSPLAAPRPASSFWPPSQYDDYFWVSADDGSEDERGENAHLEEFLLGPAPSSDEVHSAVSALQQVFDSTTDLQFFRDRFGPNLDMDVGPPGMMHRVSTAGSDLDWIEPNFHLCNSRSLQPFFGYGSDSESVVDAFRLLRTDSTVQQMVVSLSQDRAVWDAVMNNEVVRELRETCYGVGAEISTTFPDDDDDDDDEADPLIDFLRQVINHTKIKLKDVIEKITKLVSDLFKLLLESPSAFVENETRAGAAVSMEGKLRASFMLCIVVLLIVVVSRARGA